MIKIVNFDNCNSTSIDPRVRAFYMRTASEMKYCSPYYGNPASESVKTLIEEARWNVARMLNADPSEIILTSSGTEANNLAVKGTAVANHKKGNHVISTDIEHSSVEYPLKTLSRFDFVIDRIPFEDGIKFNVSGYEQLFKRTLLVSIGYANSEAGFMLPIKTLSLAARERGVPFHTDACSVAGRVKLDVRDIGCDMLSVSAHKFGGPSGVGALFVRRGTRLFPLIEGGQEENGMRGGAYDVCAIAAMGEAARLAAAEMDERTSKIVRVRDMIVRDLNDACPGQIKWVSSGDDLFYHLGFVASGVNSEAAAAKLAQKGILISPASWCVTAAGKPSAALALRGLGLDEAQCYVRICVNYMNTEEEASLLAASLAQYMDSSR